MECLMPRLLHLEITLVETMSKASVSTAIVSRGHIGSGWERRRICL